MKSLKYIVQVTLALLLMAELRAQDQLSISEALSLALVNNPELKQSALEIRQAHEEKVIARSLFLPTVYAGAQANHYFRLPAFFGFGENTEGGKIPYGRFGGDDQFAASIAAVQPLYNPLAFPSHQYAQLRQRQSSLTARAKEVEVLAQVKDTYLQILVLQERIRLTNESINRNKKVLQDSRLLFLQGKGLRVDTLRAYTSVKNLEPDLVKLTYAVETAKLELRNLIGIELPEHFVLADSLSIPVPEETPSEESLYEEVINNNPDFLVLKVQNELEEQRVRVASAYQKPTLSLVGQYQVQSQTNDFEYGNAHYPSSAFVGLQLSVPLFTGLSSQARVKQASLSWEQSEVEVSRVREDLRASVHQAIANNREALLRLQNTAVVQETAQLSYNIIQYRYQKGISPRLELTDAELALSTAQSNYLEAVYDYLSARIELRKLRGERESE
ncbi:MAG TPA: TolC family protein [Chryseosolibacter sp.]|nr:TolC family protein [Chryseosolibacter sp.]